MSDIEESGKAIQEVAKTFNNALDKGEKVAGFIVKYCGGTLEQAMGIFEDKLIYRRWENQLDLMNKVNKKFRELGLENPQKALPLKLGLPLLEASSLEDDVYLQNLWANLLVNSTTIFSLERSYISVLEQLTNLEAEILIKIYSQISNIENNIFRIDVRNAPISIKIYQNENLLPSQKEIDDIWNNSLPNNNKESFLGLDNDGSEMSVDVKLALSNLIRLRCLMELPAIGGGEILSSVHPTIFGKTLYKAVKKPIK